MSGKSKKNQKGEGSNTKNSIKLGNWRQQRMGNMARPGVGEG